MTLDAAKWNGTGGELLSCVINTFGTNLPVDFLSSFVLCTYIYVYVSYVL